MDPTREIRGRGPSPIPGAGNSAGTADGEDVSGGGRSWTDKEGFGSSGSNRAGFSTTGHSGLDRSAALGQVRASQLLCGRHFCPGIAS